MAKQTVPIKKDAAGAEVRGKTEEADAWAKRQLNSDQAKQTPLLTNAGKESYDLGAGTVRGIEGVVTGDWKQAKEGAKQAGSSILSAATLGSLRTLNNPPPQQYSGGSKEALEANRAQYDQGIGYGQALTGYGADMATRGAGVAGTAADMGGGLYGTGMRVGASGIVGQNTALSGQLSAAQRDVGSIAQQQQVMANDDMARRMMGQASAARGGNQAAAMRNAQATASQNALQTNQQLGLLRLQEEQAKRAGEVQAQQFAAAQYGDRAALGYGTANQGAGQVNQAGSTIGGVGGNIMGAGNTQTKTFVDAETEQNKAQLDADTKWASAKKASQGGVMGAVGKFVGGLFALAMVYLMSGAA